MKNQRRGFTLIELLVVVLIIGILSAIALPQYEKAVVKSRVATILPVLTTIREAQEVYYMTNGQYATNAQDLDVELPAFCTWLSNPYDSTGKNMYTCGKYFVVDVKSGIITNAGAAASYCPNKTTNLLDCLDARDFIVVQKFINATENAGKQYCQYYNTTGNTICKNLTGKSTPDTGVIYYF